MRLNFRRKYAWAYAGAVAAVTLCVLASGHGTPSGVVAVACFAVTLGWLISGLGARHVRRSIGRFREAAEAVGAGDFSRRIQARPEDELAKLIDAFNRMVDRLEKLAEEDRQLRAKLAQSERLAAIGELAATVAHEVNNPLDGIQGCTRIIRRHPQDADQVRRMLDLMDNGLYRIEMIVRRLLSLSRSEPMKLEPVSIDEVIVDALTYVQPRLDRHEIRLARLEEAPASYVMADRGQMAQVVINLLLNAMDSTGPGGEIRLGVLAPRGESDPVSLFVEDNGRGIAPELMPRIFEPFVTTKAVEGGTGLGLAVVRKIVEAHRGSIAVQSRLGEGTRFEVALPAARVDVIGHGTEQIPTAKPSASMR